MIYCLECKEHHDYCATDWMFIRCPECHSTTVVYYGDGAPEVDYSNSTQPPVDQDRIPRIIEKIEAIWWDNNELSLCQLLGTLTRKWARLANANDMELEEALDEAIWRQ